MLEIPALRKEQKQIVGQPQLGMSMQKKIKQKGPWKKDGLQLK